jgi:hypothetical protein
MSELPARDLWRLQGASRNTGEMAEWAAEKQPTNVFSFGGASRDRTDDLIVANDALSVNLSFLNQTHTVKNSA